MRLIDADALKEKITKDEYESAVIQGFAPQLVDTDVLLDYIDKAPTIEAKPVVHAHWKNEHLNRYGHLCHCCSNCGFSASHKDKNWCANCGAQIHKSISCNHEDDNHIAEDGKNGVKIPVLSMEDVPKIMEELPSVEENPILKAVEAIKGE